MALLRSVCVRFATLLAVGLPVALLLAACMKRFAFLLAVLSAPVWLVVAPVATATPAPPAVVGVGTSVVGGPSISAHVIDLVLSRAGSPAVGTGQALYDLSVQYHIDDAYALAVFQHESTFGLYGYGHDDKALGNIICAGYPTCNGRFRSYPSWAVGYEDFYQLLTREYLSHGLSTVESITPVYAPAVENDVSAYIRSVLAAMRSFRAMHVAP